MHTQHTQQAQRGPNEACGASNCRGGLYPAKAYLMHPMRILQKQKNTSNKHPALTGSQRKLCLCLPVRFEQIIERCCVLRSILQLQICQVKTSNTRKGSVSTKTARKEGPPCPSLQWALCWLQSDVGTICTMLCNRQHMNKIRHMQFMHAQYAHCAGCSLGCAQYLQLDQYVQFAQCVQCAGCNLGHAQYSQTA